MPRWSEGWQAAKRACSCLFHEEDVAEMLPCGCGWLGEREEEKIGACGNGTAADLRFYFLLLAAGKAREVTGEEFVLCVGGELRWGTPREGEGREEYGQVG